MTIAGAPTYNFGPFRLDVAERRLARDGVQVALTPKAFDLLVLLLEHRGRVVTKDDLIARLWPDSHVEEGNIKVTVSMVRKALGDAADASQYIETVPKHGYRFVMAAPAAPSTLPVARRRPAAMFVAIPMLTAIVVGAIGVAVNVARHPPATALAVLPFLGGETDPGLGYLADGLTDAVIRDLSASSALHVIAGASTARYRERATDPRVIGRELRATAILRGRLTDSGGRVVIDAEVVDAIDGRHVWSAQYAPTRSSLPAGAAAISHELAAHIRDELAHEHPTPVPPTRPSTTNLEAFQHYVQGRAFVDRRTREDLQKSVALYQRAIDEDPNYALAYAGLAEAYGNLGVRGYIAPVEGRRRISDLAARAVALDPMLAEAHMALGLAATSYAPYDFETGDRELRRALDLSPNLALGHFYLGLSFNRQGRVDEGLAEILKARELDPLSAVIARQVAICYYLKRDYPNARALIRQADALGPPFSLTFEVGIYIKTNDFAAALAQIDAASRERKDDPVLIMSAGLIHAAQGHTAAANDAIAKLAALPGGADAQSHWIAKIYATLGDKAKAFEWLDRSFSTGAIGSLYANDPVWDGLRGDPRFDAVRHRAGLK